MAKKKYTPPIERQAPAVQAKSMHTMSELTKIVESTRSLTALCEAAHREARADQRERERRLSKNYNSSWIPEFHIKFGGL